MCLTDRAQSFLGQKKEELTFTEMHGSLKGPDANALDELMGSRPMADQRGERIMLDVTEDGHLTWSLQIRDAHTAAKNSEGAAAR